MTDTVIPVTISVSPKDVSSAARRIQEAIGDLPIDVVYIACLSICVTLQNPEVENLPDVVRKVSDYILTIVTPEPTSATLN